MVQQAKKDGITINVRHAKILLCGASRAGKTSFSRLLRNKTFKQLESTDAGHTKQVLVAGKVNVVGSNWVNLDSSLETQTLTEKLHLKLRLKYDTEHNKNIKPNNDIQDIEHKSIKNHEDIEPANIKDYEDIEHSKGTEDNKSIEHNKDTEDCEDSEDSKDTENNRQTREFMNTLASTAGRELTISNWQETDQTTVSKSLPATSNNQLQTNAKMSDNTQNYKIQSRQKVSTEEEMAKIPLLESESIPETWDLFTFLDTGGQPEFINLLPAINSSTAITFIILNLSDGKKSLENYIEAKFEREGYDKDKYEYKLGYSNKDLLKSLLSSVKVTTLKQDDFCSEYKVTEDKHPKPVVYIIGTCADVLKERCKTYDQEIKDIDEEIEILVELLNKDKALEFRCNKARRYVHPIDNKVPRVPKDKICHNDLGMQTVQLDTIDIVSNIREYLNEILREKAQYEIPISWFILELELRKNDKICISLSEVQQICNNIMPSQRQMTSEQITQVLKFYHQYGMLLYFDEVDGMKNFVITNPQWLFTNLTKIIMCQFECNATESYDAQTIKMMQNGICDIELFEKIRDLDLQGIELKSFLDLLIHLKVIALIAPMDSVTPMDSGYFIPNMLPLYSGNTETIFTEREYGTATVSIDGQENKTVEPLLIQFAFGTIPRGLFGFLVVEILQQNDSESEVYKLYGQNNLNKPVLFRCANLITFRAKPCFFISLIDRISYLEIQVRAEYIQPSYHCKARIRVAKALKEVCKSFKWPFNDCRYGFLCKSDSEVCSQSPHLTLLNPDIIFTERHAELLTDAECKYDHSTELNEAHQVWFKVCQLHVHS